jgi:hypothetical protein
MSARSGRLAASGLGIALIPQLYSESGPRGLVYRKIVDSTSELSVGVAWKKGHEKTAASEGEPSDSKLATIKKITTPGFPFQHSATPSLRGPFRARGRGRRRARLWAKKNPRFLSEPGVHNSGNVLLSHNL